MFLHILEAKYMRDYTIWVRFNDDAEGEIDLEAELEGEVFGPLRNLEKFKSFHVDPETCTVVWENGADFAPEFLHEHLQALL